MSETKSSRRDFLALAATTGAGAAAVATTGAEAAETAQPVEAGAGYRETDHVKKYYELARF